MHVHCVCGGSEPVYTSGWKDFILGPGWRGGGGGEGGGDNKFSVLFKGNRKFLKQLWANRCFFSICFQFQSVRPPPGGNK